jgi:hypothetical protein
MFATFMVLVGMWASPCQMIGVFRGARMRQDAMMSGYITFPKGKSPPVAAHDDGVIKYFVRQHL